MHRQLIGLGVALSMLGTTAGLAVGSDSVAFHPILNLNGGPNELFGLSTISVGDANGDGVPDLLVRAYDDATPEVARLFSGLNGQEIMLSTGLAGHPWIGTPIAAAGDVDGDGRGDYIVGHQQLAMARVISGADGSVIHTWMRPENPGFGGSVAGIGDINIDGVPDILIGGVAVFSEFVDTAVFFSGADGSEMFALTAPDKFGPVGLGTSVAPAGDVNADGVPDVIIGARYDGPIYTNPGVPPFIPPFETRHANGSARVYSGADGSLLYRFLESDEVPEPGVVTGFGSSVAGAGDVNNDGYDDLIIGMEAIELKGLGPGGFVRVYSGFDGSILYELLLDDADHEFFITVDGMGDLNNDDHDDVIIASNIAGPFQGRVRVISGLDGCELFRTEYGFGALLQRIAVRGTDDIDGDGRSDFIVGGVENAFGLGFAEVFATSVPCRSDIAEDDSIVGFEDLAALLELWGTCGVPCAADLRNNDEVVDFDDLAALLGDWGACPTP